MSGFFTHLLVLNLPRPYAYILKKIPGHENKGSKLVTALPSVGGFIPAAMTRHFCRACLIFCGSKSKQPPAIHEGDLDSIQKRRFRPASFRNTNMAR